MMKSGTTVLVVESVEKATKFYTEKLAFDVVELITEKNPGEDEQITYAHLRKGKCFLMLRAPHIEELAEFSFIKRCASRSVGIFIEMKKGLEKYFKKCEQKGVQIVQSLKDENYGYKTFAVKDPFGIKLTFAQKLENYKAPEHFLHSGLGKKDITGNPAQDAQVIERMIKYLKTLGILRRASKKYSKNWVKSLQK
ncbi:MAG: hypothetical protein SZ59_C0004G0033 [candidate division TM6 bacterium GW2011_GWF2_28_16]|nr:MAG: hypothetical protein SZ59_C0004G0033 [candidate division TM6 bacterium GW2011_GWF2_28_16]